MISKSFQAVAKQLLGARYEQIPKSVAVSVLVFLSLYAGGIRIAIAPVVLYLTATVFTGGVMWQALSSSKNGEAMVGLWMLPFNRRQLTCAYTLAFSSYAILTKSLLILSLFFAVGHWSLWEMMIALLCAFHACLMVAAIYVMRKERRIFLGGLWVTVLLLSILLIPKSNVIFCLTLLSASLAVLYLSSADTYLFYRLSVGKTAARRFHSKGSVFSYLLRYLFTNKNYLVNTLILWGLACLLPSFLGQFEKLDILPLGFGLLCLNTPICILLSCDPSLEQAIRTLPGQVFRFCSRYCLFIFLVNITASTVYLCSWQLQYGGVDWLDGVQLFLFAFQSAALSVGLEWFYPLRNWKVESDLWHHPRKYLVPVVMMVLATLVSAWTPIVWIWLGALLLGSCVFFWRARRN